MNYESVIKSLKNYTTASGELKSSAFTDGLLSFSSNNFSRGVQGVIGTLNVQDLDSKVDYCRPPQKVIYKISKDFDFTVRHEAAVMRSLNDLSRYCPYFCNFVGLFKYPVYDRYLSEDTNPFRESEHVVKTDVLLTEYIPGSVSLTSQLKKFSKEQNFSVITQVLIALETAQKYKNFSHYDLHTDNILITECPEEVMVFNLKGHGTDCSYWVFNAGILPRLIDFGYSHVSEIKNSHLYGSLEHTDAGYLTVIFDPIVDLKVFLTGISYDLSRISEDYDDFRDFVKDELYVLRIDKKSGWDRDD